MCQVTSRDRDKALLELTVSSSERILASRSSLWMHPQTQIGTGLDDIDVHPGRNKPSGRPKASLVHKRLAVEVVRGGLVPLPVVWFEAAGRVS